jgi:hypothetical protein
MTKVVITPDDLDGSTLLVDTAANKVKAAPQGPSTQPGNELVTGSDGKPYISDVMLSKYKIVDLNFNPTDNTLQIVDNSGNNLTEDLSGLVRIYHASTELPGFTPSVVFVGKGTVDEPLRGQVILSTDPGQIITQLSDGSLYAKVDLATVLPVELVSLGGVHLGQIGA